MRVFHLGPAMARNYPRHQDNTAMTDAGNSRMIAGMQQSSALGWLIDEAGAISDAERFLSALGAKLIAEGVPLAGGALTLAAPHPIIARRTWLWRAESGSVIEAVGFGSLSQAESQQDTVARDW